MTRNAAVLLVVVGALFMSTGAVYLRFVESAEGFQILFYRSLSLCPTVLAIVCIRRRSGPLAVLKSLDRSDLVIGALLSCAFTGYVFAILNTSVASALFILTASPVIAASTAWIWIKEKPHPFTWVAMAIACGGMLFMVGGGVTSGRTFGNLCALAAAASFAVMLVFARRCRKTDILGGTFIGGLLAAVYGSFFSIAAGPGLVISPHDLLVVLAMGLFAIGIGIGCLTLGTPYIPAAEVSVLVLIESVLGPIWVWLFGFEGITGSELVGGGTVLLAVLLLSAVAGRGVQPN
ncbi:MAG: DMT family transporter [Rhodobacteraceae bacterium]|nr:DMT family transporter [Paracoccaceae bacterium]